MTRKILSIVLSFGLLFQQSGLVYAVGELNLANYLSQARSAIAQPDQFRPPQLRYISYDIKSNDFKLLLDKGDTKLSNSLNSLNSSTPKLNYATQELFNYFLIGLALPNDTFWVNLRPDAADNIIDPLLEKTDIGKIFLEADLQLKKDTSSLTSPKTPEGKHYWDKLYKRAGELFGTENITIPTITRPWIVPNEIIVRETDDSAYIYKATLKVMLEADYLRSPSHQVTRSPNNQPLTSNYSFSDPRLKELNEYSSQLIRETIIPRLTREINSSKRYAKLRQVYYSLVLSRWFKERYRSQSTENRAQSTEKADSYLKLIDSGNLVNLTSLEPCDKQTYFQAYQKSFKDGEYNLKETVATASGQSLRSYVSGGIFAGENSVNFSGLKSSSSLGPEEEKALLGLEGNSVIFDNTLKAINPQKTPVYSSSAVVGLNEAKAIKELTSRLYYFSQGGRDIPAAELEHILTELRKYLDYLNALNLKDNPRLRHEDIEKLINSIRADVREYRKDKKYATKCIGMLRGELAPIVDEQDNIVGVTEVVLANILGLRHRTANAFVVTPSGKIILRIRAPGKYFAGYTSIAGGHIKYRNTRADTYVEGVSEEIKEEMKLSGRPVIPPREIGHESYRAPEFPGEDFNVEERELFMSELTEKEYGEFREYANTLEKKKSQLSEAEFNEWLRQEGQEEGYGESWAYREISLEEIRGAKHELTYVEEYKRYLDLHYLEWDFKFKDGVKKKVRSYFTPDLLERIVNIPAAMYSLEQKMATLLELKQSDVTYIEELLRNYYNKGYVPLAIGDNIIPSASLTDEEIGKSLGATGYAEIDTQVNRDAAQDAVVYENPMEGGKGNSVFRRRYLITLFKELRNKIGDILGAKATDLFFIDENIKFSIAEMKLLMAIYDKEVGGRRIFQPLVNGDSAPSYKKLFDSVCRFDPKGRTYRKLMQDEGLELLPGDEEMLYQANLPVIDIKNDQFTAKYLAPGGHGQWGGRLVHGAKDAELPKDGKTLIRAFYNGDGPANFPDSAIVGWMARKKIPIAMITTVKAYLDKKGGQLCIQVLSDGTWRPQIFEEAQAKKAGQKELFYAIGLEGNKYKEIKYKDGTIRKNRPGKQLFNTNIALINYSVLKPILEKLAKLKSVVYEGKELSGEDLIKRIVSPDLIENKKKKDDGEFYVQLEGAIGSVLLNFASFFEMTKDIEVKRILKEEGVEKMLRFVNIPLEKRTEFFTPNKNAFDFWFQVYSDYYVLDKTRWKLKDAEKGQVPPAVELISHERDKRGSLKLDAKGDKQDDGYYADVQNVIDLFGRASTRRLESLNMEGRVSLKDLKLEGDVKIKSDYVNFVDPALEFFVEDLDTLKLREGLPDNRPANKVILEELGLTAANISNASQKELLGVFNKTLKRKDLYSKIGAEEIKRIEREHLITDKMLQLLEKARASDPALTADDYSKLNRALLEVVYSREIYSQDYKNHIFDLAGNAAFWSSLKEKGKISDINEHILKNISITIDEKGKFEWEDLPDTAASSGMEEIGVQKPEVLGGIDFTGRFLQIKLERVGSFASSPLVLPEINNVDTLDLDKEFEQIQAMAISSIRPSDTRILEFAAACYYRGEFDQRLAQVSSCIKSAHLADEISGRDSSEALRLATMLPDALYGG